MNGGEKAPDAVKSIEMPIGFELVIKIADLDEEHQTAVRDAIAAYHRSDNKELRAGCTMVAEDGTKVTRHNAVPGAEGHAEMLAFTALYRAVNLNPSQRKLRFFVLAASGPQEKITGTEEQYDKDTPLKKMKFDRPCGRCLKFISDYTGNLINLKTGLDEGVGDDVEVLLVTHTEQVIRTSMRSLYPMPHIPRQIPLDRLKQEAGKSPDRYGTGK